jgi:hypothetical protein
VFAGDALHQTVHVGSGARVVLTSQSALQVHPPAHRETPPASVRHEYRVDDGAELHCHWDPVIPFAGASLAQDFHLDICGSSRLYWSDALMSGRVSRGEVWRFSELAYQLRLEVDKKLMLLERYRRSPDRGIARAWMTGGRTMRRPRSSMMRAPPPIAWSASPPPAGDTGHARGDLVEPRLMLARLLAAEGAPFTRARTTLRGAALASIFESPQLACRK